MQRISYASALLAFLFLGGLGVLTLVDLFDGPGNPRQEFEAKTPSPIKAASQLPRYLTQARYFLNNRYALKDQFVSWNGLVKFNLLGRSPARNVSIGSDGYLFLTNAQTVRGTQGQDRLTSEEKSKWRSHFLETDRAFSELGIGYNFVIGPNKHTVYPDRLPKWFVPAPLKETRVSDVIGVAKSAFGDKLIDARTILRDAREQFPFDIYHPTDTHWTELGAALIMREALSEIGVILPEPEFEIRQLPRSGDLARMIGQQRYWDASAPVIASDWSCMVEVGKPLHVETIDFVMPERVICGSPSGLQKKLVVFHDSFGYSAVPYLASNFATVEFILTNQVDPKYAASRAADYVLFIQVAREMTTENPAQMLIPNARSQ